MAESLILEPELPPPPYSRHDPNAQASIAGLADPPASLALNLPPEDDDPSTYVADGFAPAGAAPVAAHRPLSSQQSQEPETPFASAQSYFESRQPGLQLRSDVLPHFMSFSQNASPSDFPFPTPQHIWVERDVTIEDWTTFLNYLFPHHLARENARILTRKLHPAHRSDTAGDAELVRDHVQLGQENLEAFRDQALEANSESDTVRRRRLQAVVREWNDGFFLPRALRVDPYIEMSQNAPSSSASPPVDLTQGQTPAPPFVFRVTNHDAPSDSSFPASRGWEQYSEACKRYTDQDDGSRRERESHPDARYVTDTPRFDFSYRGRCERSHHGHRGPLGHHRHMSDSSIHGQRGAPWMRPYREHGQSRRGCVRNRREHSFSGGEGSSSVHNNDGPSSSEPGRLSPSSTTGSREGHQQSASTSDAADFTRTKTALQRFIANTMNDVSKLPENVEVLMNEIYSEKRDKREGLKQELRENLNSWSHHRRSSRSTRSSVSEGTTDGPLSPRSTASSHSTRPSTDFDASDLAKAMKQSFKSFKSEMKQKQKAEKAERDADKAALKESGRLRKVEDKSRKESSKLRKKSLANLTAEVDEPMASPAVPSPALASPAVASPAVASPAVTGVSSRSEAHRSRESLPSYSERGGGWSGSLSSGQPAAVANESDEQGVERGTI